LLPPVLRDAIVFASLLSMLSAGLTLTYMTTRVPNFAHGDFAAINMYLTLFLTGVLGVDPYLGIPAGFLIGGLLALALYLLVLKPLTDRGAGYVILMIATIAYSMILYSGINIIADYLSSTYKVVTRLFILKSYDFEVFGQQGVVVVAPFMTAAVVASLHLLLNKTRFGIAMRAAIENPSLAGVVGINVNLTYAMSWFISGGLAGAAGALIPLWLMCNPDMGMRLIVSVFAASIVGGLMNIYGAFLGGILIGFAEVLGTSYLSILIGSEVIPYRPIIPLAIMSLMLLFAPRGLTGIPWRDLLKRRGG